MVKLALGMEVASFSSRRTYFTRYLPALAQYAQTAIVVAAENGWLSLMTGAVRDFMRCDCKFIRVCGHFLIFLTQSMVASPR